MDAWYDVNPKKAHAAVTGLVAQLDGSASEKAAALASLHTADELSTAMEARDVLVGFEELPGACYFLERARSAPNNC